MSSGPCSSVSQMRWAKHGHTGNNDASLPLEQSSNSRLCDLSTQTHWKLRRSILFNNCVCEEVGLVNVWFLLGVGPYLAPALSFLPLPWAGLTIPSGIVQTRLQTFPGKSSSNQVRKLGADRGGPGGPGVAQGDRNGGWEKAQVLSSLGFGFQPL